MFKRQEKNGAERARFRDYNCFGMQGEKAMFGFYPSPAVPLKTMKEYFAWFEHYFPDAGIVGDYLDEEIEIIIKTQNFTR